MGPWEDPGPVWYEKTRTHDLSEKSPLRFIRKCSCKHDQHFTARGTGSKICSGTSFPSLLSFTKLMGIPLCDAPFE